MKEKKIRFIQLEFYTIHDEPSDYMVLVEVIDDIPIASYTVKVPTPYTRLPRTPYLMN